MNNKNRYNKKNNKKKDKYWEYNDKHRFFIEKKKERNESIELLTTN